ncbi:hypothetical protein ACWCQK_23460 [Streptomyces sp. NPDC002306]
MTPSTEACPAEGATPVTGPRSDRHVPGRRVASPLCAAAAAGDLVVFQQNLAYGLAVSLPFLAAAVVQLVLARWVWASRRAAAALSAVLGLGLLIGLRSVAVGTGATLGPRGEPLLADPLAMVVLIAQLAALLVLVRTLSGRGRSWAGNGLLVIGTVLWTLRSTGLLG